MLGLKGLQVMQNIILYTSEYSPSYAFIFNFGNMILDTYTVLLNYRYSFLLCDEFQNVDANVLSF